jgi:hypothetical protein
MDVLNYIDSDSDHENSDNNLENSKRQLPIEARTKIIENTNISNNNSSKATARRRRRKKIDENKSKSTGVGKNKRSSNKKAGSFTNVVTTNTITSNAGNFEFVA